jgi:hypothetical protein
VPLKWTGELFFTGGVIMRSIVVSCVGIALLAASAAAGVVAPTSASDIVVLRVSEAGTACQGGGGQDADLRVLADGSVVPYVHPADQALIITGIDWRTTGGVAGESSQAVIRLRGALPGPPPLVFTTGVVSDTLGTGNGSALVPNVSVAPGVTVCVGVGGGGATPGPIVVHGFHASNK